MSYPPVKFSRNVFLDSETTKNLDISQFSINLPPGDFTCLATEEMRCVLTTFEMRFNIYSINQYNNIFYLYDPAGGGSYTQITIPAGSYANFTELSDAIEAGILAGTGLVATVTYDSKTRFLSIVTTSAPAGSYYCTFQMYSGVPPPGVSTQGFFNDNFEIFGAIATTNDNWNNVGAPVNMFGSVLATGTCKSLYPAQLNSMEAVFLRTNLQSNNYSTYAYSQVSKANAITPSNIFARIPLTQGIFTDLSPYLTFEDQNNIFTITIGNKQLDQMTFTVTDDKGRPLPLVATGQVINDCLSFKMTLRWEIIDKQQAQPYIPSINDLSYKFQVNNGMKGI